MGVIYNRNATEQEIYKAYSLTVYGKINRYEWSIFKKEDEDCLISIRITYGENDMLNIALGNNVAFKSVVDQTIDNFLYWIVSEKPDSHTIEEQVFSSLCKNDTLFNHRINQIKWKEKQRKEEADRIEKRHKIEAEQTEAIKQHCKKNNLFYYIGYGEAAIIKATTEKTTDILKDAQNDMRQMKSYVEFMERYPEFRDGQILKHGTIEELTEFIQKG